MPKCKGQSRETAQHPAGAVDPAFEKEESFVKDMGVNVPGDAARRKED